MENENTKSGFVAIVGRPNVGKSTLMNHLVGLRVAVTSAKPQTTRNQIRTVYTSEKGQIVFLDTPGLIRTAKNKLGEYMQQVSLNTVKDADAVLFLVEPSPFIGEMDSEILTRLSGLSIPVILVINKADTIKKTELLPVMDAYRKKGKFTDIVPVSALKGDNTDVLLDCIFHVLPNGPAYFDADTVTDQPMREIASEIIREKALMCLNEEVPHGIAVIIDKMTDRTDQPITDVEATIICEKDTHKGIIIGKGGSMLKKIGTAARYEIEDLLGQKVYLKIWVKVRKDWRDSDTMLKNLGYSDKK